MRGKNFRKIEGWIFEIEINIFKGIILLLYRERMRIRSQENIGFEVIIGNGANNLVKTSLDIFHDRVYTRENISWI